MAKADWFLCHDDRHVQLSCPNYQSDKQIGQTVRKLASAVSLPVGFELRLHSVPEQEVKTRKAPKDCEESLQSI